MSIGITNVFVLPPPSPVCQYNGILTANPQTISGSRHFMSSLHIQRLCGDNVTRGICLLTFDGKPPQKKQTIPEGRINEPLF